jgi:hypothetical protein
MYFEQGAAEQVELTPIGGGGAGARTLPDRTGGAEVPLPSSPGRSTFEGRLFPSSTLYAT